MERGRRMARLGAALLLAVTGAATGLTGAGGAAHAQTFSCHYPDGCMTIWDPIWPGESIYSANHRYRLTLTYYGDVQFRRGSTVLWSSMTTGWGADNGMGDHLIVQPDGNVVLYDAVGDAVWASGTWDPDGEYFLKVQDDGKLIIYNGITLQPLYRACNWGGPFCPI